MADYSMANRKIAYTLGRGWANIFHPYSKVRFLKIFFAHVCELSYGVSLPNLWWIYGESLVNGKKHGPGADIFSELNL